MQIRLNKLKFNLILVPFLFFIACRDKVTLKTTPIPQPDYSELHRYFPSQDGYTWHYQDVRQNRRGDTTRNIKLRGVYDEFSRSLNYYVGDSSQGTAYWYNDRDKLLCCNGLVLIDYSMLGCDGDSVLIYSDSISSGSRNLYQYCDLVYTDVKGYDSIPCIKTLQINDYDNGTDLIIECYFARDIGLILQKTKNEHWLSGINYRQTQTLLSHEF